MSSEIFGTSIRRLIVESGFAAVNYRFRTEIRQILNSLPDWIDDAPQLARVESILLFGLQQHAAARARLATLDPGDCRELRTLLDRSQEEPKR